MTDETINLELAPREVRGKAVKYLRRAGQVPAVIHDHGKDSILVQGPYMELQHTYRRAGKHHPVIVKTGSKTFTTLIKSATFEPRKNQLTHIVFNAVSKKQKVEAEVPVRAHYDEGNEVSPAERNGLIVLEQLAAVEIKATADNIPDVIEYNAETLVAVGDQITVADLIIPAGVELLTEPEHPVATVFEPSALQAANDAAGGAAEPEEAENVASEEGGAEEGETTTADGTSERNDSEKK